MELNIKRFMKVKEMILEEPARVDMGVWRTTDVEGYDLKPACSTVGCIAGWAAISYLMETRKLKRPKTAANQMSAFDVEEISRKALNMGNRDSWELFDEMRWPKDLWEALSEEEAGTPGYAAVVAQAIDRYVACDGHWKKEKRDA